MSFKEYVKNDRTNVFINMDEFASDVVINGMEVSVIEDNDKLLYRIQQNYAGLVVGDILFYITAEEWRKIPRVSTIPTANQAIMYDGRPATITNVSEQDGIYEVILQQAGGGF